MREADAIKLFVGQVPRDWTEKELREILEPYGEIHNLNLLKDKSTGQHKGCGFLTYYSNESAKSAQEELHGKRTLPGARNPLQIKPAQSETNDENRKLFIGMLSRSLHDSELREMFSSFGTIEDLKILRNQDGKSKGCAFIKFETRLQAQNAIKTMHNSQTMEGNTKPIVVKLADTEKDKLSRRMQQGGASNLPAMGYQQDPGYSSGLISGLAPIQTVPLQPAANYHQLLAQVGVPQIVAANPSVPGSMGAVFAAINPQQPLQQQQFVQHYPPQYLAQQALTQQLTPQSLTQQPLTQQQLAQQQLAQQSLAQQPLTQQQLTQQQLTQQQLPPQVQTVVQSSLYTDQQTSQLPYSTYIVAPPTSNIGSGLTTNIQNPYGGGYTTGASNLSVLSVGSNGYAATAGVAGASAGSTILADNAIQQPYSGVKQYITTVPQSYSTINVQQQAATTSSRQEGPDGANLFIYQIPVEFNDNDLLQTFTPFGNVVSAKVFVDKATGLSKCFGFVSYDSASSANLAISQMNGVVMGAKRLRVQLKRPKEYGKPY